MLPTKIVARSEIGGHRALHHAPPWSLTRRRLAAAANGLFRYPATATVQPSAAER